MNWKIRAPLALLCLSSIAASAANNVIRVNGSSTLSPMITEYAKAFNASSGIRIPVLASGSDTGVQCIIQKSCDIGLSSRSLTNDEKPLVKTVHLGWDGIAFVAHSNSPIEKLTTEQLKAILSGKAKTWRDVGGGEGKIVAFQREKGRGASHQLESELKIQLVGEVAGPNSEVINRIRSIPNSFSYMSLGLAHSSGTSMKIIAIDGVTATNENIASKTYPFQRELLLILPKSGNNSDVESFVNFILSKKSDYLLKYEFINQ